MLNTSAYQDREISQAQDWAGAAESRIDDLVSIISQMDEIITGLKEEIKRLEEENEDLSGQIER